MSEQGPIALLAYDWMIVAYFFLGGLSAGAYLFSVVVNYWQQDFKHLAKKSAILSLVALAAGMLILLYDLGQPLRAWRLFIAPNLRSPVSWGVWFLTIFLLLNFTYTALLFKSKDDAAKKFGCLGMPFAVIAATYTAMLLVHAPARLLWHASLLPVMFMNGALISGIATVMLFSASSRNAEQLSKLGKFVALLVILEVCMVVGEIVILVNGGTESVNAAKALLVGQLSFLFLGVEIFLGAVIPIVILLKCKATAFAQIVASVLIIIGIYTMRYIIVVGGQIIS